MTDNANATWLPNLIGGVSIWKIANDLNEPHMFGGRLLTPETEGSDSLPTRVEWKLTGLVPLEKARTEYGAECESAIADFQACLKKVAKEFADEHSGYHKYRSAFTVPSIEAAGSPNYFYDPRTKKVVCINWGASPRTIGGQPGQFVYDHAAWGNLFGAAAAGAAVAATSGAAVAMTEPRGSEAPKDDAENGSDKKDDGKKDDGKKKPVWPWILAALAFLALLALILFLLKACQDEKNAALDGGGDGAADSSALGEAGNDAASSADGSTDAAAAGDGSSDAAGTDAGDASADASSDASRDAGDAGDASVEEDDIDVDDDPSGGGGSSGGGSSGGAGGGKPEIHVYTPKGTNSKAGPHRVHVHPDATKWRIVSGMPKVGRTRAKGNRFDVWLKSGQTFDGVKIEWQDAAGKWHAH